MTEETSNIPAEDNSAVEPKASTNLLPEQPPADSSAEKPDWFKSHKYKSIDEQAKAYYHLEKKLGSFTGAPEAYELPEGLDPEDIVVQKFTELGKNSNMSQELFNELTTFADELLETRYTMDREAEVAALGDKAADRLANVDQFMRANLGDRYEDLKDAVSTAKTVELVEALIAATKQPNLPAKDSVAGNVPTQGDIERLMSEKDDNGRVLYKYSRARQQEVEDAIRRMVGE